MSAIVETLEQRMARLRAQVASLRKAAAAIHELPPCERPAAVEKLVGSFEHLVEEVREAETAVEPFVVSAVFRTWGRG